jgi:hypothetical protein
MEQAGCDVRIPTTLATVARTANRAGNVFQVRNPVSWSENRQENRHFGGS